MRWLRTLVVALAVGCASVGCASAGGASAGPALPVLAPTPSAPVTTAGLALRRTARDGATESIRVRPDGEWFFTPVRGSALGVAINHGRLDPGAQARLARLLTAATLHAEAALPDDVCPGGYRYRLDTLLTTATWTDCEAADRPMLTAVLSQVRSSEPDF